MNSLEGIIRYLHSKVEKIEKTSFTYASSSDFGSNSMNIHYATQQLNSMFGATGVSHVTPHVPLANTNIESPRVILCDKFGERVARGYVVTYGTSKTCHFKLVGSDEKKVYVK